MSSVALILLARGVHVLGGVFWAGSTFLLTWAIFPVGARHAADGTGGWVAEILRKAGPMVGISAILTVLSGIYLLMALHPHDASPSGRMLQAGAAAAVLSFVVGIVGGRQANRKRAAISSTLAATLLGLAVLAMATFRYVQALG